MKGGVYSKGWHLLFCEILSNKTVHDVQLEGQVLRLCCFVAITIPGHVQAMSAPWTDRKTCG